MGSTTRYLGQASTSALATARTVRPRSSDAGLKRPVTFQVAGRSAVRLRRNDRSVTMLRRRDGRQWSRRRWHLSAPPGHERSRLMPGSNAEQRKTSDVLARAIGEEVVVIDEST